MQVNREHSSCTQLVSQISHFFPIRHIDHHVSPTPIDHSPQKQENKR
jgi:hypothetical protein